MGGTGRGAWAGALAIGLLAVGCSDAEDGSAGASGQVAHGCEAVRLVDPQLAAAVRTELGLPQDAEISGAELAALTSLMAVDAGITDLSGLECATGLTELYADGNAIPDLSALADLPMLQRVLLRDNQITDISALASVPELRDLHVGGNQIVDLSPLSGHPMLFTLKAPDNLVASTAAIVDMPSLRNLDLGGNPITELEGLEGVSVLSSLRLENTQVSDLSALARVPALDNVYVDGAALTSLASVPDMPMLTTLSARGNRIADASCTASLPQLRLLDLADNALQSMNGFEAALDAATLVLDRNPLDGLDSLTSIDASLRLSINEVGIADLEPLLAVGLLSVAARSNGIVDLAPVARVGSLDLADNAIVDLGPLSGTTGVRLLDLSDNAIVDASPLLEVAFERCAVVSLAGNPAQDATAVTDALCAAEVEVSGVCLPLACDPCPGNGDCG